MPAYYNEFDPYAAEWLRNLIAFDCIAPGDVDERSIEDVSPDDLKGYEQCHFFAGIGGWSYALRLAGWPDDRPVWTGSCPCQPYSAAGARKGADDPRNLWWAFRWLIEHGSPPVIFGEQVASKDGRAWLSGVRLDLEALGYACGAADLCAAGAGEEAQGRVSYEDNSFAWERIVVGAPHIRQRLFWVADATGSRRNGAFAGAEGEARDEARLLLSSKHGQTGGLADAECDTGGARGIADEPGEGDGAPGAGPHAEPRRRSDPCRLVDSSGQGLPERGSDGRVQRETMGAQPGQTTERPGDPSRLDDSDEQGREGQPFGLLGAGNQGYWTAFDLLPCLDGKARRVEPGSFPLAHGVPARVGRLRGYGNAIVPQVAQIFIEEFLSCRP